MQMVKPSLWQTLSGFCCDDVLIASDMLDAEGLNTHLLRTTVVGTRHGLD